VSGALPPEVIEQFLARRRRERAAAGLPEHLDDPDVLARIAAIVARCDTTSEGHHDHAAG
jgi:hypothetical protein